jgi:hypothetical protein
MVYLNTAVLVISGMWLVILELWQIAWPGVIGLMISPFAFPFLMLPGMAFASLMKETEKKWPRLSDAMMGFAIAYFTGVLSAYAMFIFLVTSPVMGKHSLIPSALWAMSASVLPWALLAQKDRHYAFFVSIMFLMQISVVLITIVGLVNDFNIYQAYLWMWSVMMLSASVLISPVRDLPQ